MKRKDLALAAFQNAVELEPFFSRAWVNLGNLLDEKGERLAAVQAYRQALEATEKWKDAPLARPEKDLVELSPETVEFVRAELER